MRKVIKANKYHYDPSEADLYVVKIWYEVDPGRDRGVPVAAEEIIETVATSPQEAIEYAKKAWNGPIDRIEIVDINPEEEFEDDLPFGDKYIESSERIFGTRKPSIEDKLRSEWYVPAYYPDVDLKRLDDFFKINWNDITAEDSEIFLNDQVRFPDLSEIDSIRYFDDEEQEWAEANNFDGGYIVKYRDGLMQSFAWHFGNDDMEDVSDEI